MYLSERNHCNYGCSNNLNDVEPYLTPQEVMNLLFVGKNTVYKLLNSGELKGFRVGRQWRIERESLKTFS